jgi:hypothetical protein
MENLKYPGDARIVTKTALDSGVIVGVEENGQPVAFPYSLFGVGGGGSLIATLWGQLATGIYEGALAGGINKRLLNQSQDPNNLIISLSDSVFALAAGTYFIFAQVPHTVSGVGANRTGRIYLLDDSDDSVLIEGTSSATGGTSTFQVHLHLMQFLVLTQETACYLGHYSTDAVSGGMGWPANDGNPEIYSQISIWRLA